MTKMIGMVVVASCLAWTGEDYDGEPIAACAVTNLRTRLSLTKDNIAHAKRLSRNPIVEDCQSYAAHEGATDHARRFLFE